MIHLKKINPTKLHDEFTKKGIEPLRIEHDLDDIASIAENVWVYLKSDEDLILTQQIIDSHDPTPSPKQPSILEQLIDKEMKIKTLEFQQQQTNEDLSALMDFVLTGGM